MRVFEPAPRGLEKTGARMSFDLAARRALVVGLGRSGVAAARFMKRRGAVVRATDLRPATEIPGAEGLKGVEIRAGGHDGVELAGVDLVVASPGVAMDSPILNDARVRGIEVIGELELASRFIKAPITAVAGTNGKSTVVSLIGTAYRACGRKAFVGGNLGTPAVEFAEGNGAGACVLEVSSFQLETTREFRPHIGVLLNITPDHLDRYAGFDDYAGTKWRLFENQIKGDYAVVNASCPVTKRLLRERPPASRVVPFSATEVLDSGLWAEDGLLVFSFGDIHETYHLGEMRIRGLHNLENAMAAVAASRLAGVPEGAVSLALREFPGLAHRMETVRTLDGVDYVNDSKGTNVGSLEMALKGLTGPVVLVAGGRDKGSDFSVLKGLVREKVRCMVLMGEARESIKASLGGETDTILADSMEEAVKEARARASAGDTVLLCPACSSFDMFGSFEERGEAFRAAVEGL